jgi:sulfonate transport system ATP-binding protein
MHSNPTEHAHLRAIDHGNGAGKRGLGVNLDRVSKSFGARAVLQDIDLAIAPGEFVAIVGRSGCGKSTLLRLVAGLDTANGGTVRIGQDGVPQAAGATRIMFQEARLLPWKTVAANVALGLPKTSTAASGVLRQVGLEERARDWPAVLSGGQRQRVALARALVHEPALLLLDEPLGALDALTRIEMQQLIESVWRTHGFTAILVTHDVQEAISLADRVLLIEEGRIAVDLRIDLPRPRRRGDARFAALEEKLHSHLLQH